MDITNAINRATELSVQSRAKNVSYSTMRLLSFLASGGYFISPWWSRARDLELREFVKKNDYLAGAVYTMQARMTAIPFSVVPRDWSIKEYIKQSDEFTEKLLSASDFSEGWVTCFGKWVEDLITCDNGAFMEVIGEGRKDGPIIGAPIAVAHLDSSKCTRTGHPIYPVVYTDTNGKSYKLHYSRVIYASQMTSPIAEMNGVGLSAVSRCINIAQSLLDIIIYKQEKLGSRPHRALLITKGGLSPEDLRYAFAVAESEGDTAGHSRFSRLVIGGSPSLENADVSKIELSTLPDGFDEQTSITLGMATIALAFGMDARELFPALSTGATRAEALLQHLKQRGKGPGQILQVVEQMFNQKFLPPYLKLVFDYQDDAQDRQVAEIRMQRAQRRRQDIESGAVSIRIAREEMLKEGEIDRSQFERLELEDGRLPDGTNVLTLFYSDDPFFSQVLDLGVDDPLNLKENDRETMLIVIKEQIKEVAKILLNARTESTRSKANQAIAALIFLERKYVSGNESPWYDDTEDRELEDIRQRNRRYEDRLRYERERYVRRPRRRRTVNVLQPNYAQEMATSGHLEDLDQGYIE